MYEHTGLAVYACSIICMRFVESRVGELSLLARINARLDSILAWPMTELCK